MPWWSIWTIPEGREANGWAGKGEGKCCYLGVQIWICFRWFGSAGSAQERRERLCKRVGSAPAIYYIWILSAKMLSIFKNKFSKFSKLKLVHMGNRRALKHRIMPASRGWTNEVRFGSKKMIWMFRGANEILWPEKLSMRRQMYRFWMPILTSSALTHLCISHVKSNVGESYEVLTLQIAHSSSKPSCCFSS